MIILKVLKINIISEIVVKKKKSKKPVRNPRKA